MFRADGMRVWAVAFASALAFLAPTSFALSDDFGGSFEPDAPAVTPQPDPASEEPDDFGGSFGEGSGDDTASVPPPAADETPESGSGEVAGGSFDPDFGVAGGDGDTDVVEQDPPPGSDAASAEDVFAFESRDWSVKPPTRLRQTDFNAPTPNRLPGGYLVSTEALLEAFVEEMEFILIDVYGSEYSLPTAYVEPAMASGGDYQDRIQQQVQAWLNQLTGGDPTYPIVIYCNDPMCWLSYNASLRAVNAGYTNVYWYRGGLQAWMMAGLQVVPSGF